MLFQLCFFKFSSMCYSFYKIGKNKRLSGGPQGQVDNQYCDRQTNEMTSNATTGLLSMHLRPHKCIKSLINEAVCVHTLYAGVLLHMREKLPAY